MMDDPKTSLKLNLQFFSCNIIFTNSDRVSLVVAMSVCLCVWMRSRDQTHRALKSMRFSGLDSFWI